MSDASPVPTTSSTSSLTQAWRNYVFTAFLSPNEDGKEPEPDIRPRADLTVIRFLVFQLEECPETGKRHLQGYVELKKTCRYAAVARALGLDAWEVHFEKRRGTQAEALAYCTKSESRIQGPWQLGKPSKTGERTDLEAAVVAVRERRTLGEIASGLTAQFIKYHRGISAALSATDPAATEVRSVRCYLIWGETGIGKTTSVYQQFGYSNVYVMHEYRPVWWDGYDGQKVIVLDDFEGELPLPLLLRLTQGHPTRLGVKGGFRWAAHQVVVVLTNQDPATWYQYATPVQHQALRNRFQVWTTFISDRDDLPAFEPL